MESAESLLASFSQQLRLVREYRGGQGRTLHVRDQADGHFVLKVLPKGEHSAEASVGASVLHPSIPTVHKTGRLADGRVFVLRDHVEGNVLTSLPRNLEALRPVLQQLLEIIAFVHLRGVLHLDLKPSNLVIDKGGQLHLLDFGLAVRTGSRPRGGTPFFAAPEVLLGTVPDQRSDLFSIGAMVMHALIPAEQFDVSSFASRFPAEDFFHACRFDRADLPPQLAGLIKGCVARHPAKRFPDADGALDALCGSGSGRPSFAALAPDPVQLFAQELANVPTSQHDIRITGGDQRDRQAIAMQLAVTLTGVVAIQDNQHDALVRRDSTLGATLHLPPLSSSRLSRHLATTIGLEGLALEQATSWLLTKGTTSAAITEALRKLVDAGELLPAGTRWTWPAALSGRLEQASTKQATELHIPLETRIRQATRQGMLEHARSLWLGAPEADEASARIALIKGMLDTGEAARALPLCTNLPVLKAQALVDTGQFALAAQELSLAGPPLHRRHRRVAAKLAMAIGDNTRAYELLAHDENTLAEDLVLAALLEQSGKLVESKALVDDCLNKLDCDLHPYAGASLHTTYGHLERRQGNLDAARSHFEKAVQLAQRIGHLRHAASSQLNLGVVARDAGAHSEAASRFREAHALYEHLGDHGRAAIAKANLGITALSCNDLDTAKKTLTEASARLHQLGDTSTARLTLLMLARAHVRAGDVQEAEASLALVGVPDTARLKEEFAHFQEELAEQQSSGDSNGMPEGSAHQPSRELFRTFLAVNRKLAQAEQLDQAMATLLDAAVTLTGGRNGYLLVMRSDGIQREFQSGHGASHAQAFSRSLANQSVQEQRTLTGVDVLANEELQAMQSVQNLRIRSAICAPFHSAGGTKGAIYVEHPGRAGVFSEHDKEALEVLADQAAIAVDRMLREEAMRTELTTSKQALVVATRTSKRKRARLLGDSSAMCALRAEINKLADLPLSVLIQGETGTGKELVARALHENGSRKNGPFVAENCSALPAELMERELFGHVEGAFTGADRDRPGLLELAHGGTLFLDEVGDMPHSLQVKLLRALQERVIRRIGGDHTIELDLRMVSATHKNLREMIAAGEFREDLYFRIAAVEIRVPSLRERPGDIELLAKHFVAHHAQHAATSLELSKTATAALTSYSWPGNVRELEHVIARAALLCDGTEIIDLKLPTEPATGSTTASVPDTEVITLKEAEKRAIAAAMSRHGGDKTKVARILGISRTALYDKLKRHDLSE
ncbi:MAG: transcriptional regulator with GAF, ATPase, and Fis domain/serine/threonine protein kinase [Planctomycetota bacterium]|jgi:transcriptional regulator with GAF, ATPase, and Fis domain/serine/threonine protein kinase